jgi:hypothetical protein
MGESRCSAAVAKNPGLQAAPITSAGIELAALPAPWQKWASGRALNLCPAATLSNPALQVTAGFPGCPVSSRRTAILARCKKNFVSRSESEQAGKEHPASRAWEYRRRIEGHRVRRAENKPWRTSHGLFQLPILRDIEGRGNDVHERLSRDRHQVDGRHCARAAGRGHRFRTRTFSRCKASGQPHGSARQLVPAGRLLPITAVPGDASLRFVRSLHKIEIGRSDPLT